MDEAELIKQLSARMGKPSFVDFSHTLADMNFDLSKLIAATFHPDKVIGFRAAWLLELMYFQEPEVFREYVPLFMSKFKQVTNPSCQRHYAKILMHLTDAKAPEMIKQTLSKTDLGTAVEQCFDWLIDPNVLVAVKAHAAEALFNLRNRYAWINDELPEQLQFLMRDGTMAIQTRGKRLLSQLKPVTKAR